VCGGNLGGRRGLVVVPGFGDGVAGQVLNQLVPWSPFWSGTGSRPVVPPKVPLGQ